MMKGRFAFSFSSVPWSALAAVALCVLAVGVTAVTWQGGALFGSDFSWTNSSYGANQAYDSTSLQVEEDADSTNAVSQEDQVEDDKADPSLSASGASEGGSPLSGTVVPSEEEVVIGSGGSTPGGNPSQGGKPSGGGEEPGPGPGPVDPSRPDPEAPEEIPEIIDPNSRFEEMTDPSLGYESKPRYEVEEVHLEGRGKTVVYDNTLPADANRIQIRNEVAPYLNGYMIVRKVGETQTERIEMEKDRFQFSSAETWTRPSSTGQMRITVSYYDGGWGITKTGIDAVCDVYEHMAHFIVTNADGSQSTHREYFNGSTLAVPSEAWRLALEQQVTSDGSLSELFLGWTCGMQSVLDSLTVKSGDIAFEVRAQGTHPVPAGMRVEPREGAQALTWVEDTSEAIQGGCLVVPEGVNALEFSNMAPNPAVTTIRLPQTVFKMDIPSVVKAFPNLETWEVAGGNQRYAATADGYLVSKVDVDRMRIVSVPPRSSSVGTATVTVDEGVIGFGECAFEGIAWGTGEPCLLFGGNEVDIEEWDSLPADARVAVPESPYDEVYCRYLSVFFQHRPDLSIIDHNRTWRQGGVYGTGDDGDAAVFFYTDYGAALAYLPESETFSYTVPSSVSRVLNTAFADCTSLSSIIIPPTVKIIENESLAAPALHSIIVQAPDAIMIDPSQKLFAARAAYADDFTLYLACEAGSDEHQRWIEQLAACWGSESEAAAHIMCTGADEGGLEADAGSGAVYQRNGQALTLLSVPQKTTRLSVKEGTTAIAPDAIRRLPDLRALILPGSLRTVPAQAFADCAALEAVIYPDSLLGGTDVSAWAPTVGLSADQGCASLRFLGDSMHCQWDGTGIFYRTNEAGLTVVYALKAIGELFPEGVVSLLPQTTAIGQEVFTGDTTLVGVSGDRSVVAVGTRAFEGCTSLASMNALASLRSVGASAFAHSGLEGTLSLNGDGLVMEASAFEGCDKLGDIELSGSIASLGPRAFASCSGLTRVICTDALTNLQAMEASAFEGCPQLSEVVVSSGVRTIGKAAFKDCANLRTVRLPESGAMTTSIQDQAFMGCAKLDSLYLHRLTKLQTIGAEAFYVSGAMARTASDDSVGGALKGSLYLPGSLVSIGERAFANQRALEKLYLHGDVAALQTIGASAFADCTNLYSVTLNEATSGLRIGVDAFARDGRLSSVVLPKSLISVGARSFASCTRLANLTLKGAATELCQWEGMGDEAFIGCSALESLDLSSTVIKTISHDAFAQCTSLAMVVLPATVVAIESGAFRGCVALRLLSIQAPVPPHLASDAFEGCDTASLVVQVERSGGNQVLNAYRADDAWLALVGGSAQSITVPSVDGTLQMGAGEYRRMGSGYTLVRVDPAKVGSGFQLAAGTVRIESGAFKECQRLLSVLVPSSVTSMAAGAFAGCSSLEILAFQGDRPPAFEGDLFAGEAVQNEFRLYVTNVDHAPNYFGSLTELVRFKLVAGGNSFALVPEVGALYTTYETGGTSVYDVLLRVPRAASGELEVPSGMRFVAASAAAGCSGITRVSLPSSCLSLGDAAFKNSGVTRVDATSEVTQIGSRAFEGCVHLKKAHFLAGGGTSNDVYLPGKLEKLGTFVFKGCTSITTAQVNGKLKEIPEGTFAGCTSLTQMSGGSDSIASFKRFGKGLFAGCTAMTSTGASLTAFSGLEEIGEGAYQGCRNLSLAVFPASLRSVGQGAFSGCESIEFVVFNGCSPASIAGSGLPDIWHSRSVPVFVPQDDAGGMGIALAYETAWGSDAPSAGVDAVAASYRTVRGNLYAEVRYDTIREIDLAFLSTTTQACANGVVEVYRATSSYNWRTLYINKRALKDKTYVKRFWVGPDCVGTAQRPGIGDEAFGGTGGEEGLTLDLSAMSAVPFTGNHIFGAQVPGGTRILVKDEAMAEAFCDVSETGRMGAKLLEDYGKRLVRDDSIADAIALMLVDAATVASCDQTEAEDDLSVILDESADASDGRAADDAAVEDVDANGMPSAGLDHEQDDDAEVSTDGGSLALVGDNGSPNEVITHPVDSPVQTASEREG